jgi:hypothetical protein
MAQWERELIKHRNGQTVSAASAAGQFKESDDVGRSLAQDRKRKARANVRTSFLFIHPVEKRRTSGEGWQVCQPGHPVPVNEGD